MAVLQSQSATPTGIARPPPLLSPRERVYKYRHSKELAIAFHRGSEGASPSGAQGNEGVDFDDNSAFLERALPGTDDLTIQHHHVRQQTTTRVQLVCVRGIKNGAAVCI